MVRARVSGFRAVNFGDLLFVDHAEVSFRGHVFLVLLILDAATSLLAAYPQSNAQTDETLDQIRAWMNDYQCKPKPIVGYMAFSTPEFQQFYTHHGITFYGTGARSPWRAEAAVRLFKKNLPGHGKRA